MKQSPKSGNSRKKIPGKGGRHDRVPVHVVFFLFLFIGLITAFFVLLPRVSTGLKLPQRETIAEQESPPQPQVQQEPQPSPSELRPPPLREPSQPSTPQETPPLPEDKPAEQPPAAPPVLPPVQPSPETRDRSIYLMLDRGSGTDLVLTRANRSLTVSQTPLLDCINALLAGPTAEESGRGLKSFIPEGSRILSAPQISGNTARLNFNEEFRYNTSGREGSIAQLQQVVWTATEFSNIHDVQILIEGKQVDFLIPGIPIGGPLTR